MKSDRKTVISITILIVIWQLLLAFQGLDLADTGFHLSSFRYILDEPYSVQYSMAFWLSEILGHAWMQIWPAGGLFWCRLGGIAFFSATFLVYFRLLKEELGSVKSAAGLFIIAVFMLRGGFECLNYDIFSMLGFALAASFFYKGLTRENSFLLFLGGLAMGITIFFKMTNLAGLLFFFLIPFYVYINRKNFTLFVRLSLPALAGLLSGVGLILGLISMLGHWELFFNNLKFIFDIAADVESSHGFMPLLSSLFSGLLNASLILLPFIFACWIFIKITDRSDLLSKKFSQPLLLVIIVLFSLLMMLIFREAFWSKIRYLLLAILMLTGFQFSLDKSRSIAFRILSMTGLILFLTVPLGSDSWLGKSAYGIWILGVLLIIKLDLKGILRPVKFSITQLQERIIRNVLISVVLTSSLVYAWQNTYFDFGSRWMKHYPVKHEKLKLIYTTESRARVMNELISEAFPLIEQEYVLSFIEIPMINYLADKKPYLSTSWPKLYYSPESFERKLKEALEKRDSLPAIIRQKQNTGFASWPEDRADPNYLNYPEGMSKWPAHGKILNDFIRDYSYQTVWENEMFQLLLPGKEK